MKSIISNPYNHHKMIGKRHTNERCGGVSLTVPNQSLSIPEILRRSGILAIGRPVVYDEEPTHEGMDVTSQLGFDIIEADRISEEIRMRTMAKAKEESPSEVVEQSETDEPKTTPEQKPKSEIKVEVEKT